jgi:hypothetical protein
MDLTFIPESSIAPRPPLLESTTNAAHRLGLTRNQLNRRIANGSVPVIEAGIGRPKGRVPVLRADPAGTIRPLVVSVSGAALLLDVSHDHVRQLLLLGEMSAIDVGIGRKKLRILVTEVERWVNSRDPRSAKGRNHAR